MPHYFSPTAQNPLVQGAINVAQWANLISSGQPVPVASNPARVDIAESKKPAAGGGGGSKSQAQCPVLKSMVKGAGSIEARNDLEDQEPAVVIEQALALMEQHAAGIHEAVLSHYAATGVNEVEPLVDPRLRSYFAKSGIVAETKEFLSGLSTRDQEIVYAFYTGIDRGMSVVERSDRHGPYADFVREAVNTVIGVRQQPADDHRVEGVEPKHPKFMDSLKGLRPNVSKERVAPTEHLAHHASSAILIHFVKLVIDNPAFNKNRAKFGKQKIRAREEQWARNVSGEGIDLSVGVDDQLVDIPMQDGKVRVETSARVQVHPESGKFLTTFVDFTSEDVVRYAVSSHLPVGKPGIALEVMDSYEAAANLWASDEPILEIPRITEFE